MSYRIDGVQIDARMFCHTEKSELVLTLCIEETQGHHRLRHDDYYLNAAEALALKDSIEELELHKLS